MADFRYIIYALKDKAEVLFAVIAAFLFPIQGLIGVVILFILLDTLTGIIRVIKNKEGFTSRKLGALISKLLLYNTALISVFILDKYLLGEFVIVFSSIPLLLTKIIAAFFCLVEIISINENIERAFGINLFLKFKSIFYRVKNVKRELKDLVDMHDNDSSKKIY